MSIPKAELYPSLHFTNYLSACLPQSTLMLTGIQTIRLNHYLRHLFFWSEIQMGNEQIPLGYRLSQWSNKLGSHEISCSKLVFPAGRSASVMELLLPEGPQGPTTDTSSLWHCSCQKYHQPDFQFFCWVVSKAYATRKRRWDEGLCSGPWTQNAALLRRYILIGSSIYLFVYLLCSFER